MDSGSGQPLAPWQAPCAASLLHRRTAGYGEHSLLCNSRRLANCKQLSAKGRFLHGTLAESSSRLRLSGFKVPQQPVEGLLIHVMRLPAPKVPDVPCIANQRGPARLPRHDRVVDADRKEDGRLLLAFPCQGGFDFLLHPLTCHRRLGQDKEQLVIKADRFINLGADVGANFHIFGSKPAPYAVVLQIRLEVFGEDVVLTRIADEAGMKLDRRVGTEMMNLVKDINQLSRGEVWVIEFGRFNLPVAQATAPEKGEGEWSGACERAMIQGTRTFMTACL